MSNVLSAVRCPGSRLPGVPACCAGRAWRRALAPSGSRYWLTVRRRRYTSHAWNRLTRASITPKANGAYSPLPLPTPIQGFFYTPLGGG